MLRYGEDSINVHILFTAPWRIQGGGRLPPPTGQIVLRVRSHLATTTQIFDVETISSEIGCIVTNVTVPHMTTEKSTSLSPSANRPLIPCSFWGKSGKFVCWRPQPGEMAPLPTGNLGSAPTAM